MKKLNGLKTGIMLFFAIMVFSTSTNAANIQWDGGGDGVSWNDGLNWVNDVVPGTADNAIFPTSVGTLTVSGTASSAVSSLQIWNSANISLDLDVTVASTNATVVKLFDGSALTVKSGRTLTVTVTGTNAGAVLFDKPNGAFNVEAGGTVNLTAWRGITSFATSTSAVVNNYGTMNINATNAGMQPNNATAMTIVNHACGVINNSGNIIKIWSNAAVSSITNNGFINSTAGTGAAISVSGSNIATNNSFYSSMNGSFASGSGTKVDNGIDINSSSDTIDVMNSCSVAAMGILMAHDWYLDTTATTMVGSNDSLGILTFMANAFPSSGTYTLYSCYGSDMSIIVENVDGTCIQPPPANITFMVNTANIMVDPAGIFLAGGANFGVPGDNPLTDTDGDGIWEITMNMPQGNLGNFIFLNGNCPGWTCKESLGGMPCGDPNNFNDRTMPTINGDTTLLFCFNSCSADTTCPVPLAIPDLPITFQDTANVNYALADFNGTMSTIVTDPTDPNNLVVETTKGNGAATWAGTVVADLGLANPIPFASNATRMSVRVWSPTSGTPVRLKVEQTGNGVINVETEDTTTVAGQWETLEFDFLNHTGAALDLNQIYDKVVIFFDFGTTGNDSTYYWDDVQMMPPTIDITFLVNTANITVDPAGIFLAGGGIFGNPGDNPMTDTDGDGVYEITVTKNQGIAGHYIFLNGNCPSWSCKEQLQGMPCSDPNNFDDRILPMIMSDTTIMTCFGSCATDTVCPPPPVMVDLTFTVDMSQYSGSFTTAYVFGSFNGWNATGNPLTDQGNDIWSGTITVVENDSIEYKFLADGVQEAFVGGEPCTKTSFGFTNRFLTYGNTNMTLSTVCFESCGACYTPNIQWDGGGDGISWNDGLNWVGDLVPNSTEQAIFPTSTGTLVVSGTANPVAGIQVWDSANVTLDLDVTVNATTANSVKLFNSSMLTVGTGRTLDVTLTGVNDGCIIFTQPNGEFKVESGATANLDGWRGINSYAPATAAAVNNYGVINITGVNASIQPNNATSMTIINHSCGTFNFISGVVKIWSNAATSTFTNNGLANRTFGTGSVISVSTGNIGTNNAFFSAPNGVFASGSGTKVDNGISLGTSDTLIDATNSCSVANMGILTAYNWYADTTAMTMVGSNDTSGTLTFAANAFANGGTHTIYTCYGSDVAITVQNIDGTCVVPDTVDLTFTVDMSQQSGFTNVGVFGSFNGWDVNANGLTDQGNGLWSGTISVPENDSIEYKFITDGVNAETFAAGDPCTKTTGAFTNRFLAYGNMNMVADTVCWNSCSMCPPLPPDSVMVTFRVDMSLADSIASDGIFLAGSFNGWNDTPMTDVNNDSTYEVTIPLAELSSYEFKFKNGTNGWEQLDTTFGTNCFVPGGFGNRVLGVGDVDTTLLDYCFTYCTTCDIVLPTEFVPLTANFEMMPNPANDYVQLVFNDEFISTEKTIFVHSSVGQVVFNTSINHVKNYGLNTSTLPNGMYFITVQTKQGISTKRLIVSH